MLTYDKVQEIFADYLAEDKSAEIVSTRHCRALMMWDEAGQDWTLVVPCKTPEELFEALLWEYDKYHTYQICREYGIEDETPQIKAKVYAMCNKLREKRREIEQQ